MHAKDDTTYDIGQSVLKLSEGLQFTLQTSRDESWCLVEDELRGKIFRIGVPEFTVLSLLNGHRTLAEAIAKAVIKLGSQALDEQGMARLAHWVVDSGLARSDISQSQSRMQSRKRNESLRSMASWLNPVSTRIRLFDPDKVVTMIERLVRPFAGGWMMFGWIVVVMYGGLLLSMHGGELFFDRLPSYSRFDVVWFIAAWLILKLVHEISHAVACKRFGGRVSQFGVLILLLIPLPFVDVTSAWRFQNKYHRMLTSFAGMLSELFLASVALMIWVNLETGVIRHQLANLIIAATIHTLLFNANPLMRFDGYYIMVDWLEIPNLSTRGRNHVKQVFSRFFFGGARKGLHSRDSWFIRLYGWAALLWMFLICFSISVAAISLFGGIGLVMVGLAVVFWAGVPLFRLVKFLIKGSATQTPNRIRFASVSASAIVIFVTAMTTIPAPARIVFPFVIEFADHTPIRSETSGFIDQVFVKPGDRVAIGQTLVSLTNPELISEHRSIELEKESQQLRARTFKSQGQIAAFQKQVEVIEALEEREQELAKLVGKLCIVSPVQGIVTSQDLDALRGAHFQPGMEILTIGSDSNLELTGLVDQDHAKWLRSTKHQLASARICGAGTKAFRCSISEIPPRATQTIHQPAFAANFGGPQPVTQLASGETEIESDQIARSRDTVQGMKYLRPQVQISLEPNNISESNKWHAGQMGVARINSRDEKLGTYLWQSLLRFASRSTRLDAGI